MKLLILTTEAITAEQLRAAIPEQIDPQQTEIALIAPALHENALQFWVSDADEAIAKADQVRRTSVNQLGDANITTRSDTAEGDPIEAINDTLQTFRADRIILFTRPPDQQRYREDIDPSEIENRFGIPTSRVSTSRG
jgi:hypothetical protein